jgi:hypothetical protein
MPAESSAPFERSYEKALAAAEKDPIRALAAALLEEKEEGSESYGKARAELWKAIESSLKGFVRDRSASYRAEEPMAPVYDYKDHLALGYRDVLGDVLWDGTARMWRAVLLFHRAP